MMKTKTMFTILTLVSFLMTSLIGPVPIYAQLASPADGDYRLPAPGVLIHLSPPLDPPLLKGIKVYPNNPFHFDFILDTGDDVSLRGAQATKQSFIKQESTKLLKYFLASLTIPDNELWVNLSPYEKERIIPKSFGKTEMGRDLLAEDYMLKQITASLIYPEDKLGKKFWKHIYEQATKHYGTTNIPVNTFNKVWIIPQKAVVYENAQAGTAYVVESKLKVMLEQDYLSMSKHADVGVAEGGASPARAGYEHAGETRGQDPKINALGSQIVREIVIPELTREVNENKNFARLRQVYNSLILATWYKKKIKNSILSYVYADKKKVAGVSVEDSQETDKIYRRYLKAFKKGVYNYIKEEIDPSTQQVIPRKYFSGGTDLKLDKAMSIVSLLDLTQLAGDHLQLVSVGLSAQGGVLTALSAAKQAASYLLTLAGGKKNFTLSGGSKTMAKVVEDEPNRQNQDANLVDAKRGILLVSDGMGGHAAGEEASKIVKETVDTLLTKEVMSTFRNVLQIEQYLETVVSKVEDAIFEHAKLNPKTKGMGATFSLGIIWKDNLVIANIGDSRLYLGQSDGSLLQVSKDDSAYNWLVEQGVEPARAAEIAPQNMIADVLGGRERRDERIKPFLKILLKNDKDGKIKLFLKNHKGVLLPHQLKTIKLKPGDAVFASSDGVDKNLDELAIRRIVKQNPSPQDLANALVVEAERISRGNPAGQDDITVAALKFDVAKPAPRSLTNKAPTRQVLSSNLKIDEENGQLLSRKYVDKPFELFILGKFLYILKVDQLPADDSLLKTIRKENTAAEYVVADQEGHYMVLDNNVALPLGRTSHEDVFPELKSSTVSGIHITISRNGDVITLKDGSSQKPSKYGTTVYSADSFRSQPAVVQFRSKPQSLIDPAFIREIVSSNLQKEKDGLLKRSYVDKPFELSIGDDFLYILKVDQLSADDPLLKTIRKENPGAEYVIADKERHYLVLDNNIALPLGRTSYADVFPGLKSPLVSAIHIIISRNGNIITLKDGTAQKPSMNGTAIYSVDSVKLPSAALQDKAMLKGGIDLTAAQMNIQTQTSGGEMIFHPDPAILAQLQRATGFVPVIVNIQPMKDLPGFLGIAKVN